MLLSSMAVDINAQIVTTAPPIVQVDSKNIVITYHADQGNRALMGLPSTAEIYVHTGVITNLSTNDSDWRYAPEWGDNSSKYQLKWVADNTWQITIPSIDSFYGISDGETVSKLCFVFRTADNSAEGKTAEGGDIFVPVYPTGFQMAISSLDGMTIASDNKARFKVYTTQAADISIYVNSTDSSPFATASAATELNGEISFSAPGSYKIIAVARNGEKEYRETIEIVRIDGNKTADYPGGVPRMGAVTNPDGSVTFCVAAPGKNNVIIVGSWNDYSIKSDNQMYRHDYNGNSYFWITIPGLEAGKDHVYYYLVDGARKVGDPYAHLILDPYNDKYISQDVYPGLIPYPTDKVAGVPLAVFNTDRDKYNWEIESFKGAPKSELLIYELLIRDFTGTEGESLGNGTVNGVISKLDYLKDLGVNAIELLPIMEFDGNNSWGYNTNFYFAPDKAYGTPDDYRRLIDECHKRDMAVILDIVFNQSSGLHPWYQMYDITDNPFYNGSAPHSYSVLNDWNQDNALVQQQWHDALAYWLEAYKVDGFRFDLVKGLGNNDSYGNTYYPATNTWGPPSDAKTNEYNATRVARMKTLHDAMRKVNPNAYFINENLAGAKEENEMAEDGEINWANINNASAQFAMGYENGSGLNRFYAPDDQRTWGSTVSYAESHDEERLMARINTDGATGIKNNVNTATRRCSSVAAQMLMAPGAHMIWQFQEMGASQSTKNAEGKNDTSPKKVIWNNLNNVYYRGLMNCYKELFWLRRNNQQFFRNGVTTDIQCDGWSGGRTIKLQDGADELILAVNPTTATMSVTLPTSNGDSQYQVMSKSYNLKPTLTNKRVSLTAGAYVVYGSKGLVGINDITIDDTINSPDVQGGNGEIIINGEYNNVSAYSIDGVKASGLTGLQRGIYIVVIDGNATKVLVK